MEREQIIRMAREAKQYAEYLTPQGMEWFDIYNERFAALVASAEREVSVNALRTLNETYEIELRKAIATEREACAKVCEEYETNNDIAETWLNIVSEVIRARGQA